MSSPRPPAFFDKSQAATYDERFKNLAPMRDAMLLLTGAVLAELPPDARILCVGAGTGAELLFLARKFPGWSFTAVEPSGPMLEICRSKAAGEGIAGRCVFHEGYLDSLPVPEEKFHAATSILVSQFVVDPEERRRFFAGIAERLLPGGYLVSADLSAELSSANYDRLLEAWSRLHTFAEMEPGQVERFRSAYGRDVAVAPPEELGRFIASGGLEEVTLFYQALLIHAWFARRPADA